MLNRQDIDALRALLREFYPAPSTNAVNSGAGILVGATSTFLFGYNPRRLVATVVNASANDVFLSKGTVAILNAGIFLRADGGSYTFGKGTDDPYTGQVSAIAAAGSNLIVTTEVNEA